MEVGVKGREYIESMFVTIKLQMRAQVWRKVRVEVCALLKCTLKTKSFIDEGRLPEIHLNKIGYPFQDFYNDFKFVFDLNFKLF